MVAVHTGGRWRMAIAGALVAALVTAPMYANPAQADAADKISPEVKAAAVKSDKITFWIRFAQKAPLNGARAKISKVEKGTEVIRVKQETANTSQAWVRDFLNRSGADYQTFWISNAIKVTGHKKLLNPIAARTEVSTIDPVRTYEVPKPVISKTPAARTDAVEWGVERIGADRVWNELGVRGDGIVVANIDTGVQFDHAALAAQYRGRDANGAIDHNYNWFDPSNVCPTDAPCDNNDHGTHTMGTIVGNDGGANQIGVAPGAKWIAAKGCESSSCSDSALLASGEWMVAPTDLNGQNPRPDLAPHIVNNSWGSYGFDPFYMDIVEAWVAAGIFPAFSNGNGGPECDSSGSPGMFSISYSSGAFDIDNAIADFSSRGPGENDDIKPDLAAPGVDVRSSVPGGYDQFSGTSMASPHTAGAVALMWSAAPALLGDINSTKELLNTSAIDVDDTSCGGTAANNNVFGEGRLDAFAAVSNSPRGPLGGIAGTITSGGTPLAGASVRAVGPVTRTLTTNADGTYGSASLPVGDYTVTASKFGYSSASDTTTITEGATSTVDLPLTQLPSATISGTVLSGGAAVAGATVKLTGTPVSTTTGPSGEFSLTAPTGDYQLTATSRSRCTDVHSQQLTLTGDITLTIELSDRTDQFGYGCAPASSSYPTLTNKIPLKGDEAQLAVALPFPVPLYGTTYGGEVTISTNGNANFIGDYDDLSNAPIPSPAIPNGALFPLWDDWVVDNDSGIYTGIVGAAPHRAFAIEWRNVVSYESPSNRLSFVALIGEDGRIVYQYKDVTGNGNEAGAKASIGFENADGTLGFEYSRDQAVLTDGMSIEFRTTKHGVVRGTATDANDGLPISGATVEFTSDGGPLGSATTGSDGIYLLQLPSGDVEQTVSALNYETASKPATVPAGGLATVNASLRTARVTTDPATVTVVVPAGESRVRSVKVSNVGALATPVAVSEFGGDVPWLGASLASGDLAAGGSTTMTVSVNTAGIAPGTVINAVLQLSSQSGRTPNLMVPVKLVVPGFQSAMDSGSNNTHVDPAGDTWTKDLAFAAVGCGYQGNTTRVTTSKPIAGTNDPARFADARQGMYDYRCAAVPNGTYTVELEFAEIAGLRPNKRIFDVMIEDALVLPNLDISYRVGTYNAYTQTFTVTVTDGIVNIQFIAKKGYGKPIVNTVRITHRPDLA